MKIITRVESVRLSKELNLEKLLCPKLAAKYGEDWASKNRAFAEKLSQLDPETATVEQVVATLGENWANWLYPLRCDECDETKIEAVVEIGYFYDSYDDENHHPGTICFECIHKAFQLTKESTP